jgi:hypothetical protein
MHKRILWVEYTHVSLVMGICMNTTISKLNVFIMQVGPCYLLMYDYNKYICKKTNLKYIRNMVMRVDLEGGKKHGI